MASKYHKDNSSSEVHYHGDGLKNLVIGIGIGAAAAWLFTTKEGEILRKKVMEEEGDIEEKVKDFFHSFSQTESSPEKTPESAGARPVTRPPTAEDRLVRSEQASRPEPEAPSYVRSPEREQPWLVRELEEETDPYVQPAPTYQEGPYQAPQEKVAVEIVETSGPDQMSEEPEATLEDANPDFSSRPRRFFRRVR